MFPFHYYLILSALIASLGLQKKWYGVFLFFLLVFLWVFVQTCLPVFMIH